MEIWKAIILGLVQGLTEFLPVSSSGHLILFQKLLNVNLEAGELFLGVMLHIGTLVALIIVFAKQILSALKSPPMLIYLVVATIPAAVVGLLFADKIDEIFYGTKYLGGFFLLTALFLLAAEWLSKRAVDGKQPNIKSSTTMGLMQALAVFPGLSRSGATITGGAAMGLKRQENANFSFLMSIPIIGGAALVEIYKQFIKGPGLPQGDLTAVLLGMAAAGISGYFAIRFMLKIIKKANYKWFSLYLVVIAAISFIYI